MEMQKQKIPMESLSELIRFQLENGGRANLMVTGNSMYPMLRSGVDMVELVPVTERQKKGDIILYRRDNGRYILHRIVKLTQEGYICCGDNQVEKEPVRHDQLLAVVDGFVRKGKPHSLNNMGYRLYKILWVEMFPMRRYVLAVVKRLFILRQKMRRWKRHG